MSNESKIKNNPLYRLTLTIFTFAIAYVSWQLIGLRFTNGDDIQYYTYLHLYSEDYWGYLHYLYKNTARVFAVFTTPVWLWALSLADSFLFDLVNITSFILLIFSITLFLSKIIRKSDALILMSAITMMFPLHYYHTFPQGYPVYMTLGPICGFISASLFASYLSNPNKLKHYGAAIIFTCSLWGYEFNFILHPLLLLTVLLLKKDHLMNLKSFLSLAWPFLTGWVLSVIVYLAFSVIAREDGGDLSGRVSFGFNFFTWMKTFLILQDNSFLPISLINGVYLKTAASQGVPDLPIMLSYASLLRASIGDYSLLLVLTSSIVVFYTLLKLQKIDNNITICIIIFLFIAVIPAMCVSVSQHYQHIVSEGWIQGHPTTFYSHVGFTGLLFLFFSVAVNKARLKKQPVILILATVILSFCSTFTFVYNNMNRQVMMANKQKWDAMDMFISHMKNERPIHYAGVSCEMDTITSIAASYKLKIIEDAAQGVMASYKGRVLGSIGDFGCYSFHETKNVISGEGGSLLVNDPGYAQRAEIIREKGTDRSQFSRGEVDKYTWQEIGSSFLPGELVAAFLWAQLEDVDNITQRRIKNWSRYHEKLAHLETTGVLRRPIIPEECQHNAHMYYVLLSQGIDRQTVLNKLSNHNISSVFHYVPLHLSPAGMRYGKVSQSLTVTESAANRIIRLPLWVDITESQQDKVVEALSDILAPYC